MSKHILRFRLDGCDLKVGDGSDANELTVKDINTNIIFKLVLDKGTWGGYITNGIAIVTNTEAFTARVVVEVDADDFKDFGMSFDSQLEVTYGDNYSMDISNMSVLKFDYRSSHIALKTDITDGLTLKLYKANITNNGINLNSSSVDNTVIELDSCIIKNNNYICIGIGISNNQKEISNSSVIVKDCNINTNSSIYIGIGVYKNNGKISNSSVTVTGCCMNSSNCTDSRISIGIGVNINIGYISNSISSVIDTVLKYNTRYGFIHQKDINNITLSLDNVVVIKQ